MSYCETINYLYNLQKYGIKFGLDNIVKLTSALENPHESFTSAHVAGTNGKGSTSAVIASILKAAGLKVGLFTSPHLVSFTERIRVNGEEITEGEVVSLTEEIRDKMRSEPVELSPTFFEVVTAMALLYFKRKRIDIAVIEVGMGGRLDATNIITPDVSVITNINYDHMNFLGNTLKEIAHEKAGIIKDGIPVVISSQVPEVLEVIEERAEERNAGVYLYGRDFSSVLKREDLSGIYFDYRSDSFEIHDLYLSLAGEHQMQNASVAIKTVELISEKIAGQECSPYRDRWGFLTPPNNFIIREGLKNVRWLGRLEIINDEPPILIDGAHNPAAAEALSNTLLKSFLWEYKKIILILGIMDDKDIRGIMKPLLPLASEIILTAPDYKRAAPPAKLAGIAASLGFPDVHIAPTVKDAIELAKNICQQSAVGSHLIVVTGSFYTIGEVNEVLGHKGVLTRLRE
ncbi:MAG: folylpolyglutamate synthase/dihydrofolate synthase family protein [Nitrospirota bacterium]